MVTVRDIADWCGVSTATVSKALNGYGDVSPATAEKIRIAAEELSARPQKIFKKAGGSCTPFAVIIAQTKVEEFAEVMKNTEISTTVTKEVSFVRGNCSSRAKMA